jgi:HEAT repeat protein
MNTIKMIAVAALLLGMVGETAQAQERFYPFVRERGESSPGTSAPSIDRMVGTLENGSPTSIMAVLEYGERVECHACVPLVERMLLESDHARVREFSAWWLRRRMFVIGAITARMRTVLATDTDPLRRSRAAEALGEFMNPRNLESLATAATSDTDASVRRAAILGLGRLNHQEASPIIAAALADTDAGVRFAATQSAMRIPFFRDYVAVIGALADSDTAVRREATQLAGHFRLADAVPALSALLSDADMNVRQSAAWSLGRIGSAQARDALNAALTGETDSLVRDAIEIALRM